MSLLNSLFDVQSVDNPVALASLAMNLAVPGGETFNANGTPVAGSIPPGAIVKMNSSGQAVLASTPDISSTTPSFVFVTVDGNKDLSGSYVQVITCLHGGVTIYTDQFVAGSYTPGTAVTYISGQIAAISSASTQQRIGFVGPNGVDANGGLQVMLPQGCGI
jgi:hypothetical protein